VCAKADVKGSAGRNRAAVAERIDALENVEPAADGSLRFVLVGARIAEVHHYTVAEVLGDMAFVGEHRVPTDLLIGHNQLPQVLRVEKLRQWSRSYHVAEQHGELAALTQSVCPNLL
jgi:hypothetical protein